MNKLISSTLMTIVAVPFLMAAPAAKKVQNGTTPAPSATSTKKTHKRSAKKAKSTVAAPSAEVKK